MVKVQTVNARQVNKTRPVLNLGIPLHVGNWMELWACWSIGTAESVPSNVMYVLR